MTKNGILCEVNGKRVYLDPKNTDSSSINFVSHAHSDHLPSKNGGPILASIETNAISDLRGFKMENHMEFHDDFTLVDSGHILGAKGLLFDDIFYTGDICTRDRGFLRGAKIPKCKTLITECTFGLPEFSFPTITEIQKQVNELISDLYGKGTIHTPNINRLADAGVRFTNAYVTAPICGPSRAAILTGRYNQRFGFEHQQHERFLKNRFEYLMFKNLVNSDPWIIQVLARS